MEVWRYQRIFAIIPIVSLARGSYDRSTDATDKTQKGVS